MTKDLAVCIHGDKVTPNDYLTSEDFMAALREELERSMRIDPIFKVERAFRGPFSFPDLRAVSPIPTQHFLGSPWWHTSLRRGSARATTAPTSISRSSHSRRPSWASCPLRIYRGSTIQAYALRFSPGSPSWFSKPLVRSVFRIPSFAPFFLRLLTAGLGIGRHRRVRAGHLADQSRIASKGLHPPLLLPLVPTLSACAIQ